MWEKVNKHQVHVFIRLIVTVIVEVRLFRGGRTQQRRWLTLAKACFRVRIRVPPERQTASAAVRAPPFKCF